MANYEMAPIRLGNLTTNKHTLRRKLFVRVGGENSPDWFVDDIEKRLFVRTYESIGGTSIYEELPYESKNHWHKVINTFGKVRLKHKN